MKYLESGEVQKIPEDESGPMVSDVRVKDLDQHWKRLLMMRQVEGLEQLRQFAKKNELPLKQNSFYDQAASLVGKCVQPYKTSGIEVGENTGLKR